MFFPRKSQSEQRLDALLANPVLKKFEDDAQRAADAAALAARAVVLDALAQAQKQLAGVEPDVELAEQEKALLAQLDDVRAARERGRCQRMNIDTVIARCERDLRKHGEPTVHEAIRLAASRVHQLLAEVDFLGRARPTIAKPRGPGDLAPPMVANEAPAKRREQAQHELAKAEKARADLQALQLARLAPRVLEQRCAEILTAAGIVKPTRERWEGDTVGPEKVTLPRTDPEIYELPSMASQIVAAGTKPSAAPASRSDDRRHQYRAPQGGSAWMTR